MGADLPSASRGWPAQADGSRWVRLNDGGVVGQLQVRGRVIASGDAVEATVHLGEETFSTTDGGRFELQTWVSEPTELWAERGELRSEVRFVRPQPWSGEVVLPLRGLQPLEGRVTNAAGQPIAQARVSLSWLELSTQTDQAGAFRFASVSEGHWPISIEDGEKAYAPLVGWVEVEQRLRVARHFVLVPASFVEGVVVDASGQPVEGAGVVCGWSLPGDDSHDGQALVSDGGHFSCPSGNLPVMLTARSPLGNATALVNASTREARLVINPGCWVDVDVSVDGAPVAGAKVELGNDDFDLRGLAQALTDGDGVAAVGPVRCRPSSLKVGLPGSPKTDRRSLKLDSPRQQVSLAYDSGRTLKVHAFDPYLGSIVSGVPITLSQGTVTLKAKTDATGVAQFQQLPEGELMVSAAFENRERVSVKVVHEREIEVRLPTPRVITGRAVDAAGEPLPELWNEDDQMVFTENGRFRLLVDPRASELSLGANNFLYETIKLSPGHGDLDVGTVTFLARRKALISVVFPDGRPAAGAGLVFVGDAEFLSPQQRREPDFFADERGELEYSASREFCLRAVFPGFAPSGREGCPFESVEGSTLRLTLRLRQGAWVKGTLIEGGVRMAGAPVIDQSAEELQTVTSAEGAFALGPLSPGEHSILVFSEHGPGFHQVVTLEDGQTRTLFGPGAARVRVQVRSPLPFQLAGAFPGTEQTRGRTPLEILRLVPGEGESSGTFETLSAGVWTIGVSRPGDDTRRRQVITVREGVDQEVVFEVP